MFRLFMHREVVTPKFALGRINFALGFRPVAQRVTVHTLEPEESKRIPAGVYPLMVRFSPKARKLVIELKDVHGRSHIQFHPGNKTSDTSGCILTGTSRRVVGEDAFVIDSIRGFQNLLWKVSPALAAGNEIAVQILNPGEVPDLSEDLDERSLG